MLGNWPERDEHQGSVLNSLSDKTMICQQHKTPLKQKKAACTQAAFLAMRVILLELPAYSRRLVPYRCTVVRQVLFPASFSDC